MKKMRVTALVGAAGVAALLLTGCSATTEAPEATSATGALSGVCPSTVKVQLDWEPEVDYGPIFALLGDDYTVDTTTQSVTGPLVDATGTPTGVDIQILSGGGAIGYQPVISQMYTDPDILLGTVSTDQALAAPADQPVTAVASTATYSPYILFWDPATHPEWKTIADIGKSDATVLVAGSTVYPQWLVGKGLIKESQLDTSYDSGPARFVSDPTVAVEGYATNTQYVYENEIADWKKPVAYEALKDVGYGMYPSALSVRTEDVTAQADCLAKLIPIYQAAFVSYMGDPTRTNAAIVDLVKQYNTSWTYSADLADYAFSQLTEGGFVSNEGGTLGGFDDDRMQSNLDDFIPILKDKGVAVPDGLVPDDIATNKFIDPSIGLK